LRLYLFKQGVLGDTGEPEEMLVHRVAVFIGYSGNLVAGL
jgi:hypothetical protein